MIALGLSAAACLWLMALIGQWGQERFASIGGGSYSLDKFVYSALIILMTGTLTFLALVLGLIRQNRVHSYRAFVFSCICLVAFLASCFTYGHNLR